MVLILKWGWSPSLHNLISSTHNNTKPLRISTWSQGLNMLRIIYEPIATTISYGHDKKDGWVMRRMCWLSILVVVMVPSMCRPFWPSRRKASSLRSEGLYCWWPSLWRRGCRQSPRGPSLLLQELKMKCWLLILSSRGSVVVEKGRKEGRTSSPTTTNALHRIRTAL